MGLIVFAGPSLGALDAAALRGIDLRPPARCGDITRAAASGATAIGLIDGLFETAPAVWHKEIVFALSKGVVVLGAASMGALRAVELEPFGMIGIGAVFRAYRDGDIEDDDEVAVQHGPAELGYPPVTEAMVNIRATLDAAARAGVLSATERTAIGNSAKRLFYKHRIWPRILAGADGAARDRFAAWRAANAVDVKRLDAWRLIAAMSGDVARRATPALTRTVYWVDHEKRFGRSRANATTLSSRADHRN